MVVNYLQSHLTHSKRISYETIVQIEEQTLPKRKRSMLSYFDEIKNESLEQGVKEGEKKASEKIAENLIRDGMEISKICQYTGMSRKQVEQIQNNLQ
jgi:predicted transposase/invertase (TIGR01784 family)